MHGRFPHIRTRPTELFGKKKINKVMLQITKVIASKLKRPLKAIKGVPYTLGQDILRLFSNKNPQIRQQDTKFALVHKILPVLTKALAFLLKGR